MMHNNYKSIGRTARDNLCKARTGSKASAQNISLYKGFTLIELMVVVTIVGILAAVAVPYYFDRVEQSRLTNGLGMLTFLASRMEQNYLDNRAYGAGNTCSVAAPTDEYFTFTCSATNNAQSFTWTASYNGYNYTVDNNGNKATSGSLTDANCWAIGDGQCY